MTVTIGPIQHVESQTVECWCRHCVWWSEKAKAQERERLINEVRESGRVGVTLHGKAIQAAQMTAYVEGFHHGIREALTVMGAIDGFVKGEADVLGPALHRARSVGGPWQPCGGDYAHPDCECRSMAVHLLDEMGVPR